MIQIIERIAIRKKDCKNSIKLVEDIKVVEWENGKMRGLCFLKVLIKMAEKTISKNVFVTRGMIKKRMVFYCCGEANEGAIGVFKAFGSCDRW